MARKILIISGAFLLIGGGAAAAYFYVNGGTTENEPQISQNQGSTSGQATATKDVTAIVVATDSLSTLNTSLASVALDQSLQGAGPFTLFAPTDDAFKAVPSAALAPLLKPENAKQLESILSYHVVPGKVLVNQLTNGQKLKTINGQELTVEITDDTTILIDAKGGKAAIEKADIEATNGVVHIVSAVLLPQ
jgi:uncharacterized surface protein with fasciclin (FAS1) repeats